MTLGQISQLSLEISLISSKLNIKTMCYYSQFLKTMFSPRLGPIQLLQGLVQDNQTESLTFGPTSRLTLLISSNCI